MDGGYNRHHHIHPPNINHRNLFMPILCSRSSTKDVRLPKLHRKSSSEIDPSSPRVGCMGQVKRSNRVIGFPIPYRLSSSSSSSTASNGRGSSNSSIKYEKLKRMFSGKRILTSRTSAAINGERNVQSAREMNNRNIQYRHVNIHGKMKMKMKMRNDAMVLAAPVNVGEMDPPLPVVKKEEIGGEDVSLWKRRSGGIALKNLEVQQQHEVTTNSLFLQPIRTL